MRIHNLHSPTVKVIKGLHLYKLAALVKKESVTFHRYFSFIKFSFISFGDRGCNFNLIKIFVVCDI